jgi:phosphinothricin acetyltransferase
VEGGLASFEEVAPAPEEMAARIEATSRTHPWLVAERVGQVAGYAYASPHRARPGYRWAADVAVYVAAGQERRGVGRELYGALLPLLRRQRLRIACAGIALPNPGSVALHEAMGFEPVGTYRAIGYKAGRWLDVTWYQCHLAPGDATDPPPEPLGPQRLG